MLSLMLLAVDIEVTPQMGGKMLFTIMTKENAKKHNLDINELLNAELTVRNVHFLDSTTLSEKKKLLKNNVRSEMNDDHVNCFIPQSEEMNELFNHQNTILSEKQ